MVKRGRAELSEGSVQEVQVLSACLHRMNQQLVAAVEAEHHDLEEAARHVESEAQLPGRSVVVQIGYEDGVLGSVDGVSGINSVLEGGVVDLHAT